MVANTAGNGELVSPRRAWKLQSGVEEKESGQGLPYCADPYAPFLLFHA